MCVKRLLDVLTSSSSLEPDMDVGTRQSSYLKHKGLIERFKAARESGVHFEVTWLAYLLLEVSSPRHCCKMTRKRSEQLSQVTPEGFAGTFPS